MNERTGKRKQKRSPRGLRVLIWCLVFFFGGQALLSPVFDYLLPEYRFPWFYRLLEEAAHVRQSETILCLGSSRFGTGLFAGEMTPLLRQATGDPQVVVMNASVPGGDFITSERMLNDLLDRGVHPKLLLLEFCPDILNQQIGWLSLHTTRTFSWHDLQEYRSEMSSFTELKRFITCRLFPLFQYRHSIRGRLNDRWLPSQAATPVAIAPTDIITSLTDYHWTVELSQPAWPLQRQLREIEPHFEKYQIGGKPVACLRRILQRCQQEQIQVMLIEPPVAATHRQFYTPAVDQQFTAFTQQLCSEFNLARFSYRQAVPEEGFHDHHHCNRLGAHRWSEMLTQEVLIPTWTRQISR